MSSRTSSKGVQGLGPAYGAERKTGLPVTQPVRATRGEEAVSVAAVSHFQTSVIFGSLLGLMVSFLFNI